MVGEFLSLAPTIVDFYDNGGEITYERLMGKPKPEEKEESVIASQSVTEED